MIYHSGSNTSTMEFFLQLAMKKFVKWCGETRYKFPPAKTVAMHICRRRSCPKKCPNLQHNETITCKDEHRHLGLIVDNSLRWNKHVKQLKIEYNSRVNILKIIFHTAWGADMEILKMLYQALTQPELEYGNEIYESTTKTNSISLIPACRKSLTVVTEAFRSLQIDSFGITRGELTYARHSRRYTDKLHNENKHNLSNSYHWYTFIYTMRWRNGAKRAWPL